MTRSIGTLDRLCLGFIIAQAFLDLPVHAQEPVAPGRMIEGTVQIGPPSSASSDGGSEGQEGTMSAPRSRMTRRICRGDS